MDGSQDRDSAKRTGGRNENDSPAGSTPWPSPAEPPNGTESDPSPDAHSAFAEVQITEARDQFYRTIRRVLDEWAGDIGGGQGYAEHIPKAPTLLRLLENLALEEAVSARHKAQIAVARAYFTAPQDAMPEEMVGPCGYVDDLALAALVADRIANSAGEAVVRRCWPEEGDPIPVLRDILGVARYAIGPEAWTTIRAEFRAQVGQADDASGTRADGDDEAPHG